jgi:hypothetical protein
MASSSSSSSNSFSVPFDAVVPTVNQSLVGANVIPNSRYEVHPAITDLDLEVIFYYINIVLLQEFYRTLSQLFLISK